MSRLTRDGIAEPVSRDQIPRRKRGHGNIILDFPVQLTTSRISNLTRLILTLAVCDDHTYINTAILLSASYRVSGAVYPDFNLILLE